VKKLDKLRTAEFKTGNCVQSAKFEILHGETRICRNEKRLYNRPHEIVAYLKPGQTVSSSKV
jgi:hypothetical protein